jgi:hypothetical protein
MKDDEARRVSVNYCVRDSFIQEVEDLMRDIDPGDYRVKDGAVVRYGGEPLTNPRTLAKVPAIAKCDDELERRVLEGEHYWSKLASEDAKKEIKARFNQWKVERKKVNDAVEVDQADSEEE